MLFVEFEVVNRAMSDDYAWNELYNSTSVLPSLLRHSGKVWFGRS